MYNPLTILVLGAACGALIVLFARLAIWLHSKDAAQSAYQQYRSHYAYSKGMALAGFASVGCVMIAVVGAMDPIFGLPHLEWPAGVLVGAGVPLGLWRLRLRLRLRPRGKAIRPSQRRQRQLG